MDKERNRVFEELSRRWPGLETALSDAINELESTLNTPWLAAKTVEEGRDAFVNRMTSLISRELEKLDQKVLADVCAHSLAPMLIDTIREIIKAREGGDKPCK